VTRLQQMLRLSSGRLSICVRELERAGYVRTAPSVRTARSVRETTGSVREATESVRETAGSVRGTARSVRETTADGARTTVALTSGGRAALDRYTDAVLPFSRLVGQDRHSRIPAPAPAPAPHVRVGDADRDAAAAALGEHFAQGRLTLDELRARLDATLTALTHRDLSRVTRDLPDLTVVSAQVSRFGPGRRARSGRGPGHGSGNEPWHGAGQRL
jgi:Domain of unknown function (DUF1707)